MPGALFEYILDKVEELEKYALEESVSGEKAQDDSPAELWGGPGLVYNGKAAWHQQRGGSGID